MLSIFTPLCGADKTSLKIWISRTTSLLSGEGSCSFVSLTSCLRGSCPHLQNHNTVVCPVKQPQGTTADGHVSPRSHNCINYKQYKPPHFIINLPLGVSSHMSTDPLLEILSIFCFFFFYPQSRPNPKQVSLCITD